MSVQEKIINWLFATGAIRVCQPDQPFWYTSGTLGPYYVNTHFLFGSEQEANELLALIEDSASDPLTLPGKVAAATERQYQRNALYHDLCDLIVNWIKSYSFDLISGGERRDFFFSIQTAKLLDKPHLSLLKNGTAVLSNKGFTEQRIIGQQELKGLQVLHVADLVTEASSYQRAWLPAVRGAGAAMPWTLAIVDRDQGGREYLASEGTELLALTRIERQLFEKALAANLITKPQLIMIEKFMASPQLFLQEFLSDHPDFLDEQIAAGGKNRERALRCLDKGYDPKKQ